MTSNRRTSTAASPHDPQGTPKRPQETPQGQPPIASPDRNPKPENPPPEGDRPGPRTPNGQTKLTRIIGHPPLTGQTPYPADMPNSQRRSTARPPAYPFITKPVKEQKRQNQNAASPPAIAKPRLQSTQPRPINAGRRGQPPVTGIYGCGPSAARGKSAGPGTNRPASFKPLIRNAIRRDRLSVAPAPQRRG